jgi:hypothetical protein
MKKSLFILTALSMSFFLMAQGQSKQKEIGLVFNNLNNFGLTFRIGTEKALWRFNTLYLSGNNVTQTADSSETKNIRNGFGLKLGREYRKTIIGNLEFRFGADLSFNYSNSKVENNDKSINNADILRQSITYQPGINLVLGFNYVIHDKFVIGAEVMPYFSYITGTSVEKYYHSNNVNEIKSKISGFSYGLSNSSVLVSLIYRFGIKK